VANVDRNLYFNNLSGKYEEGYRDPVTHVVHFGEGDAPEATDAAIAKATELSINLGDVEGTGKEGRVTAPDVQKHAEALAAAPEGSNTSEGGGSAQNGSQTPQTTDDEEEARRQAEEAAAQQVSGQ
jgi:pyruvate/2-oxoglutarate dehydrogenase complex dihydrolipoamide acyltransferase (E2) component